MIRILPVVAFLATATVAKADIAATFIEGAPKDRFVVTNTGSCAEAELSIEIDLAPSAAGLIFDTTGSGAGVEVFQPFELVAGGELLKGHPEVRDGMNAVTLTVPSFPAGASIAFTVDVDDTSPSSSLGQIRVSGSEIFGAVVRVNGDEAGFETNGRATLARSNCNA